MKFEVVLHVSKHEMSAYGILEYPYGPLNNKMHAKVIFKPG